MAKIFTKLAEQFPRYILLQNNEIVKNEDGTIKEFGAIKEIEDYTDVNWDEGLISKYYKYYGSFD